MSDSSNFTAQKWYKFDKDKGYRQKRPPIKKWVLVLKYNPDPCFPPCVVAGYRKDAAGDASCPYFVTPGAVGLGDAIAWCDCLPEDFKYPELLSKELGNVYRNGGAS